MDKSNKSNKALAGSLLAMCTWVGPAAAVEYDFSGFASLVAGKTSGACTPGNGLASAFSASCTRFVADWGHAGVYDEHASIEPESRAGLQGTARISPSFSATAQVVARLAVRPLAGIEQAYLTWSPSPSWSFQLGRKRLPLLYYSDIQDVGHAYPWVRVPPDVYGWDVVNYNGANLNYRTDVAGWSLRSGLFGGFETSRKNPYSRLFYDEGKDVEWPKIAGAELELRRDWFTGRVAYMRSDYEQIDRATGLADVQPSGATKGRHRAWGASANVDHGPWLVRTEYSVFDRSRYAYRADSWLAAVGYRIGRFTQVVTVSDYSESTNFPAAYDVARWSSRAFTLRYDLGKSSALKVQVDRLKDRKALLPGSATLVSTSYDLVF